ncbi:MAG: cytochrome ubiquinol oxidase subunit I [Bacteroidota bacterium]|nr:cytochrome ubiquinol oxidase subunit I [Bacteroidota bacterium]
MNYPFWDIPFLGGGWLIGIVAVIHVFVSHFAVGGGLFLVLTEHKAYRENNLKIIDYLKIHSKFFILLTLVFGALTGVAIWFTIGLVTPMATSSLIHIFVWGWAIEWVFFFIEIAAVMIYFYTWEKIDRKTHLIIGWIYFISAWMSMVVINGILSFMLTPGAWTQTRDFWDGLINPTYFSSLAFRTLTAIVLAGIYALFTASLLKDEKIKQTIVKYSCKWVLPFMLMLPLAGLWYYLTLPEIPREIVLGGIVFVHNTAIIGLIAGALIFFTVLIMGFFKPNLYSTPVAVFVLLLGLASMFAGERVRESVRKPYVLVDYMYSNGLVLSDFDKVKAEGLIKNSKWSNIKEINDQNKLEAGNEAFKLYCSSCHIINGYNDVLPLITEYDEEMLTAIINELENYQGYMPKFAGTEAEAAAIAKWLTDFNKENTKGEIK